MKKTIIFIFVLALIIGGFTALSHYSNKVYYNEEDVTGNLAGNLYNGGLYCEVDGTIYFSNPADDGALYSMAPDCTDVKKLSTDKVASINADEHYIYYSRRNYAKESSTIIIFNFENTGIYRYTKKNGKLKQLFGGANGVSCLYGNTIYYQHYDEQTAIQLYGVGIDREHEGKISTDGGIPASIYGGILYYAADDKDHYLHALNLNTKEDQVIFYDNCFMPVAMPGGIYYIASSDNYAIYRIGYDGGDPVKLVDEFCFTFNITEDEKFLFYQIDGGDDNRLVCLDLTTGISRTIMDGNFKQINITSQFVFFTDFSDLYTYAYQRDTGIVNRFEPPVLKMK